MIRILSQNNKKAYDLITYIADTTEDFQEIDTTKFPMGTECYVISEQKWYMLNSSKEWKNATEEIVADDIIAATTNLASEQASQIRENIGAISLEDVGTIFTLKGSVAVYSDLLQKQNPQIGDVWYVEDVSAGYIWMTSETEPNGYWEELGETIDLSALIMKNQGSENAGKFLIVGNDGVVALKDTMINISYIELKALRDGGNLIPSMQYRITDYVCTVANDDEARAVSHPFDIIVTADSNSALNENARACLHAGDIYYSASDCRADLSAWELKYTIDNDTDRFAWADDTNGKGVIFWMKDDWGNECPYDFKQIQFKRYEITACPKSPSLVGQYAAIDKSEDITIDTNTYIWCYTFSWVSEDKAIEDISVMQYTYTNDEDQFAYTYENVIQPFFSNNSEGNIAKILSLNNIVFLSTEEYDGGIFYGCSRNTFGNDCYSNTFGNNCYSNTFGNICYSNTFGNNCYINTFGTGCHSNTFGNDCSANIFGTECFRNIFGTECPKNIFGNYCYSNTFGDDCSANIFGIECSNNIFGNYCYSNTFGNGFGNNTFGNNCYRNTFGNSCYYNKFGTASSGSTAQSYFRYNTFEDGVQYVILYQGTTSNNVCVQNYHVLNGLQGSYNNKISVEVNTGLAYCTFIGKNTSGTITTYNIMDNVITNTITGTTASITPVANNIYNCGELTSLTISSPPATGAWSVVFTSGSTPTTTTIPATILGLESFAAEANTMYEINVLDNRAVVGNWAVSSS